MRTRKNSPAFTLLELVVVLAILSIVTALAMRSLSGFEDQRRFEVSQRGLQELSDAILGSPDDRATDGTRTVSGFVADMGRLPRTTARTISGQPLLTLDELLNLGNLLRFDVRAATVANGISSDDADGQVIVPSGWRGPYLHPPISAPTLLDGWGNFIASPQGIAASDPDTAHLRDENDRPITTASTEIRMIDDLGANGRYDTTDTGYDQQTALTFSDDKYQAALVGHVEVIDTSLSPARAAKPTDLQDQSVTIRVYGPNSKYPTNPALIAVTPSDAFPFTNTDSVTSNPITWSIPTTKGLTIGPRIVRAYLNPDKVTASTTSNPTLPKSSIKFVTLRPGTNMLDLTIYK